MVVVVALALLQRVVAARRGKGKKAAPLPDAQKTIASFKKL
jgi:hypothetical protein